MDVLMGLLVIIGFIVCYAVGRAVMGAMGIIMIDTIVGIVIKPIIVGFFTIIMFLAVIALLFKGLWFILVLLFKVLLYCSPVVIIVGLIVMLVKKSRK